MHSHYKRGLLTLALLLAALLLPRSPAFANPAQVAVRDLTLGVSLQGRPITAVVVGDGPRKLVVVGATHGGPEANTYRLTLELIDYYRANPAAVPPDVRLYLIPVINPDGLALDSRFDSQGVDLNRNMNTNMDTCPENDWRTTVFGAYGLIADTGGPYPDSQLEVRLLRTFLLDAAGAIFLHSNAGLVFPASCDHTPSLAMGQAYAQAAGYVYSRYWPNYQITGGMHDWAGSLGITAITPELISPTASEFAQNLAGVQAVMDAATETLPLPTDRSENGQTVPAALWRYWRAHGGVDVFGPPIGPARPTAYGLVQRFSRAQLELHTDRADTPFLVQATPLRVEQVAVPGTDLPALRTEFAPQIDLRGTLTPPAPPFAERVVFDETGHVLFGAFLDFWRRNGGADVFGPPVSDEFTARTLDGQQRIVQRFSRAVFAYYPEDGRVRLEPLGWQQTLREGVAAGWLAHQVR